MQIKLEIKNKEFKTYNDKIDILFDGYIIPRNECFDNYIHLKNEDLIFELYNLYKEEFIHHLKGIFYIIIKTENQLLIFTDRLGLKKIYYQIENEVICFSDTFDCFSSDKSLTLDKKTLIVKSILNREINDQTIFENVKSSCGAFRFKYVNNDVNFGKYWNPEELIIEKNKTYDIEYFEKLVKKNIKNITSYFNPEKYSITLTGGKDSRTGLCTLLNLGIEPFGFTYGNPKSKDAVYAKLLAEKAKIKHAVYDLPKSENVLNETIEKIISLKNPTVNIHRAHRFYAFKNLENLFPKNQVYVSGYLAGELLMGVYYDDTVFPNILTQIWENKSILTSENFQTKAEISFIKLSPKDIETTNIELSKLKTLQNQNDVFTSQLYGIFELGIPHHYQDIYLSSTVLDYPYPFFLDIDFLDDLFRSDFSFKFSDNKSKNLFKRYKLYYFNLNLQNRLFPILNKVPFAKKGNYTTDDYIKGSLFWSIKKVMSYLFEQKKYPPNFNYDTAYYNFVLKKLHEIEVNKNHEIHSVYDVEKAIKTLKSSTSLTQEKHWHRFTNIISTYLYYNKLKNEN